jgi:hypothetical protein
VDGHRFHQNFAVWGYVSCRMSLKRSALQVAPLNEIGWTGWPRNVAIARDCRHLHTVLKVPSDCRAVRVVVPSCWDQTSRRRNPWEQELIRHMAIPVWRHGNRIASFIVAKIRISEWYQTLICQTMLLLSDSEVGSFHVHSVRISFTPVPHVLSVQS